MPFGAKTADRLVPEPVVGADLDAADRARLGAHTGSADRALKRRPGGSRSHEQKFPAAEHQLAVCADIEKQRQILPRVEIRHQKTARDIAAQIICDRRHTENIPRDGKSKLGRAQHAGVKKYRRIGTLEHLPRVAAEEKVQHRRIAADRHGRDSLRRNTSLRAAALDHLPHVVKRQRLKRVQIVRVLLHGQNAVEDVRAELRLAVGTGCLRTVEPASVHKKRSYQKGIRNQCTVFPPFIIFSKETSARNLPGTCPFQTTYSVTYFLIRTIFYQYINHTVSCIFAVIIL